MSDMDRLLTIMARLRDPQTGCPWDIKQDFKSIAPFTLEEAYEVADAIERGDVDTAASALDRASEFDPSNPDIAELRARILPVRPDGG